MVNDFFGSVFVKLSRERYMSVSMVRSLIWSLV